MAYSEQLTVYLDILGFSKAVMATASDDAPVIEYLLRKIQDERTNARTGHDWPDGRRIYRLPYITVFSDSIVISFRLDDGSDATNSTDEFKGILGTLHRIVGRIAQNSLTLGLLIRGGLAIGSLSHLDGIVFGPAMLEAHELEKTIAKYPRIAVSPSTLPRLPPQIISEHFLRDADGIWHFDYFRSLTDLEPDERAGVSQRIARNIKALGQGGRWKDASKWEWLKSRLEQAAVQPADGPAAPSPA